MVRNKLKEAGYTKELPTVDNHLFFQAREYIGPNQQVLHVGANNIPLPTYWDLCRTFDKVRTQLPLTLQLTEQTWTTIRKRCTTYKEHQRSTFPTTKNTYTLRKHLEGMVIGETDKNLNELWACCPTLYQKAWHKAYNEKTGYKAVSTNAKGELAQLNARLVLDYAQAG